MLLQLFQFSPLFPSAQFPPSLQKFPLSSFPWVVHVSSLASLLPILLPSSPLSICTYPIMLLNPVPFPSLSPFPFQADNPPYNLHIYDSIPVLVVCLVCFLDSVVDVCEFVVILIFLVLIFFLLGKSL